MNPEKAIEIHSSNVSYKPMLLPPKSHSIRVITGKIYACYKCKAALPAPSASPPPGWLPCWAAGKSLIYCLCPQCLNQGGTK